jgi:lipoprotein-anchoring transpeptidase ErfK/SrfK
MRVTRLRAALGMAAIAAVGLALVAGCTAPQAEAVPAAPAAAAVAPAPSVTVDPADGSTAVAPAAPVTVSAKNGKLTGVTLVDEDGEAIPGTLSGDGATWTAAAPPKFGTTYHFTGTAAGSGGTAPVAGSFTTATPKKYVRATSAIGDGQTVGVAAPIMIQFSRPVPVASRAAIEKALSVTTSVPVTGSWAWLPDAYGGSRVHWRPKDYWPVGTKVSMAAHLYGVDMGTAGFGKTDLTTEFTIGRSQVVKADARTHRIQVVRAGQTVMDLPASYGAESDSRRVTRSGTHIVMGKSETVLMSNPAFGYTDVPEHWAVRISNNGEFIHANPASTWAQGKRNVTHGCINLSTKNAKGYFDTALFGDPVEVTGTAVGQVDGDVRAALEPVHGLGLRDRTRIRGAARVDARLRPRGDHPTGDARHRPAGVRPAHRTAQGAGQAARAVGRAPSA